MLFFPFRARFLHRVNKTHGLHFLPCHSPFHRFKPTSTPRSLPKSQKPLLVKVTTGHCSNLTLLHLLVCWPMASFLNTPLSVSMVLNFPRCPPTSPSHSVCPLCQPLAYSSSTTRGPLLFSSHPICSLQANNFQFSFPAQLLPCRPAHADAALTSP